MKFIRQQQKKNVQFSKSEIDFLNNFNNFEQFASFSNAFKNLYNKILNFAEEGEENKKTTPQTENDPEIDHLKEEARRAISDGQIESLRFEGEINSPEDILDPEYFKAYAAMRADSDLGRVSGHHGLSKYVDRYAKRFTDEFKKSKDDDFDGYESDLAKNLLHNNTSVTARNALKKYPSKDISQDLLEDQIESTRLFLGGGKLLPTPENVMDSVRSGGLEKRIDWSKPEEVKRYQSILDYYNNIYRKNPEDLKALTWNNNQRGNTAYA